VDALVRQWCQNALKKKLFAMSVPTKSLQRARMMRHAQFCYQRSEIAVQSFGDRSCARVSAPAVDSGNVAQARNGRWCLAKYQEAQGPPREIGLLVYRGPRSAARLCGLYWWSLSVAKGASSSVLTNCYSVARAARDMAVSKAHSIGQCSQRPRCIWGRGMVVAVSKYDREALGDAGEDSPARCRLGTL
jgi:hypothetical protein